MTFLRVATLALGCAAAPLSALELALPTGSRQLSDRDSPLGSYRLPTGPWADGSIPVETFEGAIDRQTWRIDSGSVTTLQVLDPLRKQIADAGYDTIFACKDQDCGGFDFRFETEVVPAPDMHVDIRDYRFLSAVRGESEALSLLVSRGRSAAYVQVIRVDPEEAYSAETPTSVDLPDEPSEEEDELIARLRADGHVVLPDLEFQTGADKLINGPYDSLAALADFLKANPDLSLMLVGHTDSVGTLDQNIALSKRRAEAVRTRMLELYDLPASSVQAEGMGFLSPVASNLTAPGREANRRVEAVVLPKP